MLAGGEAEGNWLWLYLPDVLVSISGHYVKTSNR